MQQALDDIRQGNMKILHFYRTYFPDTQGGLEEAIRQICLGTGSNAVENRVLTLSENPTPAVIERPEAVVYRARLNIEIASCSMGREAFHLFQELSTWADLIHYHFPWPFADLVKVLTRNKKPYLITYHSDIVRQRLLGTIYAPLANWFLANSKTIVTTSPNYLETSAFLNRYRDKTQVIPIGIDEDSYPTPSHEYLERARAQYGDRFFLFVGVMRAYKGLDILLDACRNIPYKVLIAGSGPEEIRLKQKAAQLKLTNVIFLGHIPDELKMALLKLCCAMVLPSNLRSEAFGVSLLEAAMAGKPMISTEIGTGTSFVNIHQETGLIIPPSDSALLRSAMDLLYREPERAAQLGANARRRFENHFTAEKIGREYSELYSRIVGGHEIAGGIAGIDNAI